MTQPESIAAARTFALDKLGHVDLLVNTAGVTGATGDFDEIDDLGWQKTIDINLLVRCEWFAL